VPVPPPGPSPLRRLGRHIRRRPDLYLAAVLTIAAAAFLISAGQLRVFPASACVLGFSALIALRRWQPVPIAVAAGLLAAIPQFDHSAYVINNNGTFVCSWAALFLYAYALGSDAPFPLSILGIAALLIGVNLSDGVFNPVPEMLALGPYAAGLAVASRRTTMAQLEQRARELEEEREIFAVQSVRYERARIARELHDIVAHCVSLMVVQANAGERLAATDPELAAQAFASISEAAQQADGEINRLVELLHDSDAGPATPSAGLRIVEELVARAQSSGLAITCQLSGDIDDLSEPGADAAYRLVQEGITNAMKHAPGASMEIQVDGHPEGVEIVVLNGPPLQGASGLESSGGANGLAGMRERVTRCGGTFSAGPTPDGGWRVTARLPHRAGSPLAHSEGT
jgi:signal transduction histidine kinase